MQHESWRSARLVGSKGFGIASVVQNVRDAREKSNVESFIIGAVLFVELRSLILMCKAEFNCIEVRRKPEVGILK